MCVNVNTYAFVCGHMWRLEVNLILSQLLSTFSIEAWSFTKGGSP